MLASRFGVRWSGEKSQPAPAALAEIPFGDEGDAEKAKYPHCNLTNVQLLGDVAILVATAGVAHEIGTISPVALILAAAAPVPIAMLQPFVSKNAYAAGLMRLRRDNEVDDDGVENIDRQNIYPSICFTGEGMVVVYSTHAADPAGSFGNGGPDGWRIGGGKTCILAYPD